MSHLTPPPKKILLILAKTAEKYKSKLSRILLFHMKTKVSNIL